MTTKVTVVEFPLKLEPIVDGEEIGRNTCDISRNSLPQTINYFQHTNQETKNNAECESKMKSDYLDSSMRNQMQLKQEINRFDISETEEKELKVSGSLKLECSTHIENSLEASGIAESKFEDNIKEEITTEELKLDTEYLIWMQSGNIRHEIKKELLSIEVRRHEESRSREIISTTSQEEAIENICRPYCSEQLSDYSSSKSTTTNYVRCRQMKRYYSSGCSRRSLNDENLSPVRTRENREKFTCNTCTKTFSWKCNLLKHVEAEACDKFICPFCRKVFHQSLKLERHIRSHKGEKSFTCNHCMKKFSRKEYLIAHMNTHLKTESISHKKEFHCRYCNKVLANRSNLNTHLKRHGKIKPFKCAHCNRGYRIKDDLNKHIKEIHSQNTSYNCKVCGKSFARTNTLNRHAVTHSTHKGFRCSECDRSFSRADSLSQHKKKCEANPKSKTNEFHFICEFCVKHFASKSSFKVHLRMHLEKPLKCNFCNKKCSRKVNLVQHMKTHLQNTAH